MVRQSQHDSLSTNQKQTFISHLRNDSLHAVKLYVETLIHFGPPSHNTQSLCYYNQDLHCTHVQSISIKTFHRTCKSSYQVLPNTSAHAQHTHTHTHTPTKLRSNINTSSIFGTIPFGRYLVTHFLADIYFHNHRPTVHMEQTPYNQLRSLRHLISVPGSSQITTSAYQTMAH